MEQKTVGEESITEIRQAINKNIVLYLWTS